METAVGRGGVAGRGGVTSLSASETPVSVGRGVPGVAGCVSTSVEGGVVAGAVSASKSVSVASDTETVVGSGSLTSSGVPGEAGSVGPAVGDGGVAEGEASAFVFSGAGLGDMATADSTGVSETASRLASGLAPESETAAAERGGLGRAEGDNCTSGDKESVTTSGLAPTGEPRSVEIADRAGVTAVGVADSLDG